LADIRIDPNKPRNNQTTPLWMASQNGHLVVVQHLLATGREIDTRKILLQQQYSRRASKGNGRKDHQAG